MSVEITVTLPDTIIERAQLWAQHSGRPLDAFLAEAIELSLQPLGEAPKQIDSWSDEEVLSGLNIQLSAADDTLLSELLDRQRECPLSEADAAELQRLMLLYQEGLLRKAIATREAVRRGLHKTPLP